MEAATPRILSANFVHTKLDKYSRVIITIISGKLKRKFVRPKKIRNKQTVTEEQSGYHLTGDERSASFRIKRLKLR